MTQQNLFRVRVRAHNTTVGHRTTWFKAEHDALHDKDAITDRARLQLALRNPAGGPVKAWTILTFEAWSDSPMFTVHQFEDGD